MITDVSANEPLSIYLKSAFYRYSTSWAGSRASHFGTPRDILSPMGRKDKSQQRTKSTLERMALSSKREETSPFWATERKPVIKESQPFCISDEEEEVKTQLQHFQQRYGPGFKGRAGFGSQS